MNRLLQAKIGSVRAQFIRNEITLQQYTAFVDGVNAALSFFGLHYSEESHEIISENVVFRNAPSENALDIAQYKRGYFLVGDTFESMDTEIPAEYTLELERVQAI